MYFPLRVGRESRIVRHHADRGAVGVQLLEEVHHRFAVLRVEVTRRLVGEEDGRLAGDGAGHGDTLLLTAGELCRIVVRAMRHPDALERVGMSHRMKHYPAQLSGGQQQRVAVARAVAGDPLILLADEPTGNLDSTNGEAVMELLRELHRGGATICMVTHDPRYAAHADRSIHLFDGRVVEERRTEKAGI